MRIRALWGLSAIGLLAWLGASTASAANYVSWAGGFYITIPDDWEHIDYQTVDAFLISNQAGPDVLNYDAAFAPRSSRPFFTGNYLILTVDTVGELSRAQIDSVLSLMSATFGEDIKYYPVADFLSDMKSNAPSYDAEKKLITVVNDIMLKDEVTKKLMHMTRFYERGMATFYFYSPDSLFDRSTALFSEIVQSLSTENIEAAAGAGTTRVADIDPDEESKSTDDDGSLPVMTYIVPILVIMITIFAVARKRRRKSE